MYCVTKILLKTDQDLRTWKAESGREGIAQFVVVDNHLKKELEIKIHGLTPSF